MTQDQIEAVRRDISALRNGLLYPWQHDAAKDRILAALDHLTKANEELRAEVEELRAANSDNGELLTIAWMDGAHRSAKGVRQAIEERDATIDRLTKERDEAVAIKEWAMHRDHGLIERLTTRLSAMQEAIDEAVWRADEISREHEWYAWNGAYIATEPLRPFATKPEQFDPVEHGTRSDGEACSSAWVKGAPCDCNLPKPEPEAEADPLEAALIHAYGDLGEGYNKRRAELVTEALAARGGRVVFGGREG